MSDTATFSPQVRAKARQLLRQDHVHADPDFPTEILFVTPMSPEPGKPDYRVQIGYGAAGTEVAWATCTCPFGLHKGGAQMGCAHVLAVLMKLHLDD